MNRTTWTPPGADGVSFDLPPGSNLSIELVDRRAGDPATLANADTLQDSLAGFEGESLVFDLEGSFGSADATPLRIRLDANAGERGALALAVDEDGDLHFLGLPAVPKDGRLVLDVDLNRLGEEEEDGAVLISPGRVAKLWVKKVLRLPDRSLGLFTVSAGPGDSLDYSRAADQTRAAGPHALVVHGALSEARAMEGLSRFLLGDGSPREYAGVMVFDYETVATGVQRNGEGLRDALVGAGFGADRSIDVFAYSMGTQVTRSMVELAGSSDLVRDVVLIAPPNGGTRLANEQDRVLKWGGLLVNAAARAVDWAGPLGTVLSSMMKIVEAKDDGLDDLRVNSAFHRKLETEGDPGGIRYHTIAGVTPDTPGFLRRMLNATASSFYDGDNDWVVPLESTVSPHDRESQKVDENHFAFFRDTCLPIGWVLDGWLSR